MIMSIIGWAIFGLIVGAIAKFLLPGKDPGGLLVTMLVGVVGSFIGGAISYVLPFGSGPYNPAGWIMSIVGAVVLLILYRKFGGSAGA